MGIVASEIKYYRSQTVSDAGSNGGRMSANQITSGAAANVFPAAGDAERTAGSVKRRKVFIKVANDADLTLFVPKVIVDKNTPGGDRITFHPATQTDTQSGIVGNERQYGGGTLNANVSAGASTMDVLVESAAAVVFVNGDKVRVSNKPDVNSAGDQEFVTLTAPPSYAGDVATLNFTPSLQNAYLAANTRVAACYEPSEVKPTVTDLVVTSAAGTFNVNNLLGDSIGTVEQVITCTFTSATNFSISSDVNGSLGTGNVGAGASPSNPNFAKPYFVMQPAGFGGTFQAGDTIVFQTHPAAVPIWVTRNIPAGTAAFGNNNAEIAMIGETSG